MPVYGVFVCLYMVQLCACIPCFSNVSEKDYGQRQKYLYIDSHQIHMDNLCSVYYVQE